MKGTVEVEVKFFVPELDALRERLIQAGAGLHKARVYERNVCFDDAAGSLLARRQLLRLRQDTAARLTFKGEPQAAAHSEAKVREELEVGVTDFVTAVAILERLGFRPQQVYEKYRETFHLGPVEVVLDELPFGNFVELEGDESAIRAAAARLGLDWQQRIVANYLYLMAQLKARHNLPFDDLTFDNFRNRNISIESILEETTCARAHNHE
jgi:adenylate cyclase, class 2